MPIVNEPTTSGSLACEPKGDCFSEPGLLVEACPKCGEKCDDGGACSCVINEASAECSPCSTTGTTAEKVQGKDACGIKGTASTASSTACNDSFRGTTRVQQGFPLVKSSPGDKCLKHLSVDVEAFQVSVPGCGVKFTRSPNVDIPIAQGYKRTVAGNLLIDIDGKPVLGDTPEFTDLWISGLKGRQNRLFRLRAPKVDEPIALVAQKGAWRLRADGEKKLCSEILPDTAVKGRLLLIDREADCEGEEWCLKELKLDLEEGICVNLVATQDEDGRTQLGTVTPSNVAGFLRSNPEAPCSPVNGANLSDAERTQFTGFLDQTICDPDLPAIDADGHSTVIDRLIACGTRTFGPQVTVGSQPFTLEELRAALKALDEAEGDDGTPVDVNGGPLEDGFAYDAVWDDAESKLVYKPAHRAIMLANQLVATYNQVNQTGDGSTPYSVNLAAQGIIVGQATHIELFVQLDTRWKTKNSNGNAYTYVEVNGARMARTGQVNLGQTSNTTSSTIAPHDSGQIRVMVPIVSGAISFKLGHAYNLTSSDSEFWAEARLYAMHQFPLTI